MYDDKGKIITFMGGECIKYVDFNGRALILPKHGVDSYIEEKLKKGLKPNIYKGYVPKAV
jgi:hypothetical protein